MSEFGILTPRMAAYREKMLSIQPRVCAERAVLATESEKEHRAEPLPVRRARLLERVLERMTIYIEPETLLAGNQASSNRAAPVFPEYAIDWLIDELDEFERRDGDRFQIDEADKARLREIAPFWEKNTLKDAGLAMMPERARLLYDIGVIKAEGNITSGDAHIAANYPLLLRVGLADFKARAEAKRAALDLTDAKNIGKYHFYRAVSIAVDAVTRFAERYALLAEAMAPSEPPQRARELREMARILRKVPAGPAETLREAVQSLWLVHCALQIESNGHSLSYGRMDQYLYPFYARDLEAGRITREEATELMVNLWLKTLSINKIRPWSHTRFSAGSPLYQNVTIGGQTPDGRDAVNEFSDIILDSVAQVRLPQPNLTVRYHKGLSDAFLRRCVELIRLGIGMPAFNNDEVIIESLIEKGVKPEDAMNYSAIGCVEVAVPGKWGYRCTGMSFINFPRILLIAMNDGIDPVSGARAWAGMGHFRDMKGFSQLMAAWDACVRDLARQAVVIDSCCDLALEHETADILLSALCDDCIERGLNLKQGGAVYDFISDLQVGIANLADSLAAIKKVVFEDGTVSPAALWDALTSNFEGEEGARIRQALIAAPKYGNDDDLPDLLLKQAYESYIDEIKRMKNTRYGRGPIGGTYYAGTSSISANVPQGASTPATPDGRLAGEPLAEGCSPSHGMDVNGPTAVFRSVAKLPTREITGGVLLNQKLTPDMLAKPENREKLILMLRAFFNRLKGFHVQYNVVSRETLLDAQAHPEKHRDLIVRVAGYSAFFTSLSRTTQDDIIARTEQEL